MRVHRSGVVTLVLLLASLITAGVWVRSFWVNDIWEKQIWVSSARRNDSVAIGSVAGRVQWGRSNMVLTSPERIRVYESNAARVGVPTWQHLRRRVGASEREGWLLPDWRTGRRSTPDWTNSWVVVDVPCWPAVVGLGWVAAIRMRRRAKVRRWEREGRCLACGYDLRASPGTCPECGTSPRVGGRDQSVEVRDVV